MDVSPCPAAPHGLAHPAAVCHVDGTKRGGFPGSGSVGAAPCMQKICMRWLGCCRQSQPLTVAGSRTPQTATPRLPKTRLSVDNSAWVRAVRESGTRHTQSSFGPRFFFTNLLYHGVPRVEIHGITVGRSGVPLQLLVQYRNPSSEVTIPGPLSYFVFSLYQN
jgi:hypothetical protein